MDNATRLLYLEAMGITVWQPKSPSAPSPSAEPVPNDQTASEPIGLTLENDNPEQNSDAFRINAVSTALTVNDAERISDAEAFAPQNDLIPNNAVSLNTEIYHEAASPSAVDQMDWDELEAAVAACTQCGLCQTRTQTVFGSGNKQADWMLIGEAPGQQEDLQGAPFVGPAGQLLTEMLRAIGLDRDEVYITNILKCRPPGNRDPKPEEAAACRPYLERQIALIRPKIILAVGRIAAQTLLRTDAPISKLRGRVHTLNQTPLVVVYHPSYLLRSMLEKKKAWLDLQLALGTYQKNKNKG
ncbi:MAG: uracil-DNA glycosylase [Gammaproteobacteria bacterium]